MLEMLKMNKLSSSERGASTETRGVGGEIREEEFDFLVFDGKPN